MTKPSLKRNLFILVALFIFSNSFLYAQKNFFTISAGASKALGEGSNNINLGFNGSLSSFTKASNNVFVGGKISYNHFGVDTGEIENTFPGVDLSASMSILELLPIIRIFPSVNFEEKTNYFLQAGLGYYSLTAKATAKYQGESNSDSESEGNFGLNLGIGIILGQSGTTKVEVSPNYNIIFTEDESTKYFSINVGIIL